MVCLSETKQNSSKGLIVWFTGLSGAGKTTLAEAVSRRLQALEVEVATLDGDVLRQTLCAGLGFSRADRMENVRRIAALAESYSQAGTVVLVAVIAPYREGRTAAREKASRFIEVYVNAPLAVCIERDTKGLYAKALAGKIECFTGISDPYDEPLNAELECRTDLEGVEACTNRVMAVVMAALGDQYVGCASGEYASPNLLR